jgi:hypothetical protein
MIFWCSLAVLVLLLAASLNAYFFWKSSTPPKANESVDLDTPKKAFYANLVLAVVAALCLAWLFYCWKKKNGGPSQSEPPQTSSPIETPNN